MSSRLPSLYPSKNSQQNKLTLSSKVNFVYRLIIVSHEIQAGLGVVQSSNSARKGKPLENKMIDMTVKVDMNVDMGKADDI